MKDFAKSIVCNTKAEAAKVGNAYQYAGSIPIEKIPDNWRPEFPKAGYIVYYAPNKAKWFATEAEAKKFAESQDKAQKAGNSKCGNELTSYEKAKKSDLEKRLKKEEQLLEDAKKMLRSKLSDDDRIGFQMQKEECEKNVSRLKEEIRKIGNSKVGNASFDAVLSAIQDVKDWAVSADNWANGGKFSATNITSALSHCKNACDKAMRLAQEYDRISK